MNDRGTRRAQKQRNLNRWRRIAASRHDSNPEWDEFFAQRSASHGKRCSCWMCGNPRRHNGERTYQERKHGW